ncbi:MAG: hypothetical protein ACRDZ3_10240 [Acidimicrobiia bacterium]
MDQTAKSPHDVPSPPPQPISSAPSDRGLLIMVVVLGLAFMAFVLLAGVAGLTP